jgi:CRISPR system Cascade subunit CasC
MTKTIIDIHVIQTVPPSCLNRDDTGRPKTALYGGVQRARVSSQAWKKAVRDYFKRDLSENSDLIGIRTLEYVPLIAQELQTAHGVQAEDADALAKEVVSNAGITKGGALLFISLPQIRALANLAANQPEKEADYKKEAKSLINKDNSIDIALFGRMVADDAALNSDASCQVAHAISVDQVENEFDFFTAIDEVKERDENQSSAGAGMLGTVEFNSSTLYRYATIYADLLVKELSGDVATAKLAVQEFLKGFVLSMPTGKSNTFGNSTPPTAVYVAVRNDQPVNLVNAFEQPIGGTEIGTKAIKILQSYAGNVYQKLLSKPDSSWVVSLSDQPFLDAEKVVLQELVDNVGESLESRISSDVNPN